jgi:hypothetical protein
MRHGLQVQAISWFADQSLKEAGLLLWQLPNPCKAWVPHLHKITLARPVQCCMTFQSTQAARGITLGIVDGTVQCV